MPKEVVFAPNTASAYVRSDNARDVLQVLLAGRRHARRRRATTSARCSPSSAPAVARPTSRSTTIRAARRYVLASTPNTGEVVVIDADTAQFRSMPRHRSDRSHPAVPDRRSTRRRRRRCSRRSARSCRACTCSISINIEDPLTQAKLRTITLDKPVRDVVPVPGRDLAMLVHDDARTVLGLLDMDTESTSPLLGVGKLDSYDFSPSGSHLIGATDGVVARRLRRARQPAPDRLPPRRSARARAVDRERQDLRRPRRPARPRDDHPVADRDAATTRSCSTGFLTDQPPRPGALTCAPSTCSSHACALTATAHAGNNELSIGSTIRALRTDLGECGHRRQPASAVSSATRTTSTSRFSGLALWATGGLRWGGAKGTMFQTLATDVSHDAATSSAAARATQLHPALDATAHLELGVARAALALRDDDVTRASATPAGARIAEGAVGIDLLAVQQPSFALGLRLELGYVAAAPVHARGDDQNRERRHPSAPDDGSEPRQPQSQRPGRLRVSVVSRSERDVVTIDVRRRYRSRRWGMRIRRVIDDAAVFCVVTSRSSTSRRRRSSRTRRSRARSRRTSTDRWRCSRPRSPRT